MPYDADPEGMRPALAETGTIMDWVFDTYTIAPALDTTQPCSSCRFSSEENRSSSPFRAKFPLPIGIRQHLLVL